MRGFGSATEEFQPGEGLELAVGGERHPGECQEKNQRCFCPPHGCNHATMAGVEQLVFVAAIPLQIRESGPMQRLASRWGGWLPAGLAVAGLAVLNQPAPGQSRSTLFDPAKIAAIDTAI